MTEYNVYFPHSPSARIRTPILDAEEKCGRLLNGVPKLGDNAQMFKAADLSIEPVGTLPLRCAKWLSEALRKPDQYQIHCYLPLKEVFPLGRHPVQDKMIDIVVLDDDVTVDISPEGTVRYLRKNEDQTLSGGSGTKAQELFPTTPSREHVNIVYSVPSMEPSPKRRRITTDLGHDIVHRWATLAPDLPDVTALRVALDAPLSEEFKIPASTKQFNSLLQISALSSSRERLSDDDLRKVLRISETDEAMRLYSQLYTSMGTQCEADGTEESFVHLWDLHIRDWLEMAFPNGHSIRNSNEDTCTLKLRPDYGHIQHSFCAFRGEEKGKETSGDPKQELSDKLVWMYQPAPYVLGYHTRAMQVTLCAIQAPNGSEPPSIVDLVKSDLGFRAGRVQHLRRLVNMMRYISKLNEMVPDVKDFVRFERDGKTIEIGAMVKKTYTGPDRQERVKALEKTYNLLVSERVPNVDELVGVHKDAVYLKPVGYIGQRPQNTVELIEAVTCVLAALRVMHNSDDPILHRDIRWPNLVRRVDNRRKWMLIDWEDSCRVSATRALEKYDFAIHSPRVFVDGHGCEVDMWGVGHLILRHLGMAIRTEVDRRLQELGRRLQEEDPPRADEALELLSNVSVHSATA